MYSLQRKALATFCTVSSLLIFLMGGTFAAQSGNVNIKEIKYEVTGKDESSVSLVVIVFVTNSSEIGRKFDLWIDVLSSNGKAIGHVSFDGVDGEARSDTRLTKNITVPRKNFSTPLKLKGTLKNVK
ncbi:MAG: hypothetical protein OEQ39_09720 [Gammaproteobacteria bacterium]|nr:hypothetical protein [Gammaproteobacteria bacterium]MDH3467567.1 hypothetical protein [Gammaproteobacteria bacterium]